MVSPLKTGLGALAAGLALSATAAWANASAPPCAADLPVMIEGLPPYHRAEIANGIVDHAYGRNAAWGRWRIPVLEVVARRQAKKDSEAVVVLACRHAKPCIYAGELEETPRRIERHALAFTNAATAARFRMALAAYRQTCRASR